MTVTSEENDENMGAGSTLSPAAQEEGTSSAALSKREAALACYRRWCTSTGRVVPLVQDSLALGSELSCDDAVAVLKAVSVNLAECGHRVSFFGKANKRGEAPTRYQLVCECHGPPSSTGIGSHCGFSGTFPLKACVLAFRPHAVGVLSPSDMGNYAKLHNHEQRNVNPMRNIRVVEHAFPQTLLDALGDAVDASFSGTRRPVQSQVVAQLKELAKKAGFELEDKAAQAFVDRGRKKWRKVQVTAAQDVEQPAAAKPL